MSMPRYTWAESIDTISSGRRSASAMARRDLPLAVGPSSANALPATSDVEDRPADVRRFVGREPENRPRDFLRVAGPAERRGGADALGPAGIAARGVDLGEDDAGPHGIHADAFAADFLRQAERHRIDRALCRGVVDVHRRRADARGHRRDIDDCAAGTAMPRRHALQRLARAEEAAGDVDCDHALEARHAHLVHPRSAIDHPGVVHQHRKAPETLIDLREHAYDVRLHRDVASDRDAVDLARERLARAAIAHVVDADLVAALRCEPRGRGADAAARAGD